MPDRASAGDDDDDDGGEQTQHDLLRAKLDVLNCCHGTFLSMRELEICISLVDYRLGTATPVLDVLDAFLKRPLLRWELLDAACSEGTTTTTSTTTTTTTEPVRGGGSGSGNNAVDDDDGEVRDALVLVNVRAGTSFLLHELELVVALMGFVHGVGGVGLRDVLGLRVAGLLHGRLEAPVEKELVGAFGTLDIRVGEKDAVRDLGDVFSQATL